MTIIIAITLGAVIGLGLTIGILAASKIIAIPTWGSNTED